MVQVRFVSGYAVRHTASRVVRAPLGADWGRWSFTTTVRESRVKRAMKIEKMLKRYRVDHGQHFRLKDYDPADTHGLESELKPQAKELLAGGVKELSLALIQL